MKAALNSFQITACAILFLAFPIAAFSQTHQDIAYKSGDGLSEYEKSRCQLDIYAPEGEGPFPVLVWFHGGGLQNGDKSGDMTRAIARYFQSQDVVAVVPNYRLNPKVKYPAYIMDASASVAWTLKSIQEYKGDPKAVFISGHSAGGYLTAMIGLDRSYLMGHQAALSDVAGFIPVSGQMITHSTVRQERGIPSTKPIIDAAAPSFHVNDKTPPFLNICGGNDLPARAAENLFFVEAMKAAGHAAVEYVEVPNRDHTTIVSQIPEDDDVASEILMFIREHAL